MSIQSAIENLKTEMEKEGIVPETGLGNEMFLFSSTLAPVVNVDLLITDGSRILLSWRNDPHCGQGWHIPGGCIRFKEKLEERIQKTAMTEIGTAVSYDKEPVKVFEIFSDHYREGIHNQRERAHFVTLAYCCWIPDGWSVGSQNAKPGEEGYLKWFDSLPDELLAVQNCYKTSWNEISKTLWRMNKNEQVDE